MKVVLTGLNVGQDPDSPIEVEHDIGIEVAVAQKAFLANSAGFNRLYEAEREYAESREIPFVERLSMLPAAEIPRLDPALSKSHYMSVVTIDVPGKQFVVRYQDGRTQFLDLPPQCLEKLQGIQDAGRAREILLDVVNRFVLPRSYTPPSLDATTNYSRLHEQDQKLSAELDQLSKERAQLKTLIKDCVQQEELPALQSKLEAATGQNSKVMAELLKVRELLAEIGEKESASVETLPDLRDEAVLDDSGAAFKVLAKSSEKLPIGAWKEILKMKLVECREQKHLVRMIEEEIEGLALFDGFDLGTEEHDIGLNRLFNRLGNHINLEEGKVRFLVNASQQEMEKSRSERLGSTPKG